MNSHVGSTWKNRLVFKQCKWNCFHTLGISPRTDEDDLRARSRFGGHGIATLDMHEPPPAPRYDDEEDEARRTKKKKKRSGQIFHLSSKSQAVEGNPPPPSGTGTQRASLSPLSPKIEKLGKASFSPSSQTCLWSSCRYAISLVKAFVFRVKFLFTNVTKQFCAIFHAIVFGTEDGDSLVTSELGKQAAGGSEFLYRTNITPCCHL